MNHEIVHKKCFESIIQKVFLRAKITFGTILTKKSRKRDQCRIGGCVVSTFPRGSYEDGSWVHIFPSAGNLYHFCFTRATQKCPSNMRSLIFPITHVVLKLDRLHTANTKRCKRLIAIWDPRKLTTVKDNLIIAAYSSQEQRSKILIR